MMLTANALKLELQPFEARTPDEFRGVFSKIIETRPDAIAVTDDTLFVANARRIADIMANNRLPSVGFVDFAQVGGLIGYGVNFPDLWYRGAYFVTGLARETPMPRRAAPVSRAAAHMVRPRVFFAFESR